MDPSPRVLAFGELLWDLLPDGPALGGAPANFAAMLAGLMRQNSDEPGHVALFSSVGQDALEAAALEQLRARFVSTEWIAQDPTHPTGAVEIALVDGVPSYTIREDVAWDFIAGDPRLLALAPHLGVVYFGTLAQRSEISRATLQALVDATSRDCLRLLDINLRPPWWTPEILRWSCSAASVVKMSAEEVPELVRTLGLDVDAEDAVDAAQSLLQRFAVELVAITRGAEGSLLVARDAVIEEPGLPVRVADTVGAGDAFTAGLTYALLQGLPLQPAAALANRCGAWAASRPGGMPPMTAEDRDRLLAGIF
jgi:fructokinase